MKFRYMAVFAPSVFDGSGKIEEYEREVEFPTRLAFLEAMNRWNACRVPYWHYYAIGEDGPPVDCPSTAVRMPSTSEQLGQSLMDDITWDGNDLDEELGFAWGTVTDFQIVSHGSVWSIKAVSPAARHWVAEHVYVEPWQGRPTDFIADHRPARDFLTILDDHGFTYEGAIA